MESTVLYNFKYQKKKKKKEKKKKKKKKNIHMYVYTYAAMYESFLLSCSRPDQHPNLEFRLSPTK